MRKAVIVVGSNYGDEGKGLASAFAAGRFPGPCLNVLINGGPQRGHTVDLPDGRRHVFHHFGSGSVHGAVSCFDADFMINPMTFADERETLIRELPNTETKCIVSEKCRVTTPYDMIINQIMEERRGSARHGSCGMGIFETRHRYETMLSALRFGDLVKLSWPEFQNHCRSIADEYLPDRIGTMSEAEKGKWAELLRSDGLIEHFYDDIRYMVAHTQMYSDWAYTAQQWENIVFEAGQGLALDENNIADHPHLTPSYTTSRVSAERIAALNGETDTEIIYVTRTYFTRHGAGPLPGECPMQTISPEIIDRTNMPNPFQKTIRYAPFEIGAFRQRVEQDIHVTRTILPNAKTALLVTHLNETGNEIFGNTRIEDLRSQFDRIYLSDSPTGVGK